MQTKDWGKVEQLRKKLCGLILFFQKIESTYIFVYNCSQYNLTELFKELKEKEGIGSIDDILRQVIKPDGMSFNGIQPVYRELLMKLAMSMSRDEIFIRSQNIMDEEKGISKWV